MSISCTVSVARYWLKITDFNLPHLYFALPLRVMPLNFAEIFGIRKAESMYGVVFVILSSAISINRLLTDRQTDAHIPCYGKSWLEKFRTWEGRKSRVSLLTPVHVKNVKAKIVRVCV